MKKSSTKSKSAKESKTALVETKSKSENPSVEPQAAEATALQEKAQQGPLEEGSVPTNVVPTVAEVEADRISAVPAEPASGVPAPIVEAAPTAPKKAKKVKPAKDVVTSDERSVRRAARAILKATTLKEIPGTIRMRLLVATAEPSDEAIAKLIAEAKEIGLDLAHCNWTKTARAIAAGDLKLAK
jgi:hypothetical protein